MEDLSKEMGLRVSRLRNKRGWSRNDLFQVSGVGEKFIYEVESGQKCMGSESLIKISKALNVTADYLLLGSEDNTNLFFITEALKRLNEDDLQYVEKILLAVIEALSREKK